MRVLYVLIAIFLIAICAGKAASKDKDEATPPWMEDIIAGERKIYLIPKGAKKEVFGSHVIVEATEEYVARRIYEIEQFLEERFKEIDQNHEDLLSEIENLKNIIEKLEAKISTSAVEAGEDSADDAVPEVVEGGTVVIE